RGVDEDRQAEPGARLPDRVQLRVVDPEPRAVRLADREPERLRDLAHAHGARGRVRLELGYRALRPPRPDVAEVDPRQEADPVPHRGRGTDELDGPAELLPAH